MAVGADSGPVASRGNIPSPRNAILQPTAGSANNLSRGNLSRGGYFGSLSTPSTRSPARIPLSANQPLRISTA